MIPSEPLFVPDAVRLAAVQKLCDIPTPYAPSAEVTALFQTAMAESVAWHAARSPFYARLLAAEGGVPFVAANFFKSHEVLSIPKEEVFLHLTSSGTTGQKSQIFFDEWTIKSAQRMVDFIFDHYGWRTPDSAANYLLYSYEPKPGFKVGTPTPTTSS